MLTRIISSLCMPALLSLLTGGRGGDVPRLSIPLTGTSQMGQFPRNVSKGPGGGTGNFVFAPAEAADYPPFLATPS
jgi:hypothetical protein